jgi:MFS superfamily sulfate permease-like transporter
MKYNKNNTRQAKNTSVLNESKTYFAQDATAGFIIFLLALPLSLGIAKASEVPPIMGLVTAIIGGLVVSFFTGSRLSIKGPAAGLIVIVAGSVQAFGGGEIGWKLALGAMFVSGLLQILFGIFKMGKFVDFFPLAVIHGMLAAIGVIIIAKQFPILLNINPELTNGLNPMVLLGNIPKYIANLDPLVSLLGVICLAIMLLWPKVKHPILHKIPAAILVLGVSIPYAFYFEFDAMSPKTLVSVGNIIDSIAVHIDFGGVAQTGIFIKFVIMFALVGSIESLLTVKGIDLLTPEHESSNSNKDLIAIGIGNTIAAIIGGIPMISEVARSSANVYNGAKTRWANFYHAFFLLFFAITAYSILEMIPTTALAAMLIAVGYNLAHPKHWIKNFKIGPEQLVIFTITIIVTLVQDLLVGVAFGILVKLIYHIIRGASLRYLFWSQIEVKQQKNEYQVSVHNSAIFSNYLGLKKELSQIPAEKTIRISFEKDCKLIDHSVMESLDHFRKAYNNLGGKVIFERLEEFTAFSNHQLAGRNRR